MSDKSIENHSGNKYIRPMPSCKNHEEYTESDVYCVIEAFAVTCPGRQHALKKILCSGIRGKGDELQDIQEAIDALEQAKHLAKFRKHLETVNA